MLIVDDEPELDPTAVLGREAGRQPFTAEDGRSALTLARGCAPHAVVLDGMLPDLDGVHVLRRLRYENAHLPVLMLTARDTLEHRIDGLSAGADDYVTKPFSLEEVMLRLRGLLRRAGAEREAADEPVRVLGDLVLAGTTRQVQRDGTPIALTAKEFDLLSYLIRHPRQISTASPRAPSPVPTTPPRAAPPPRSTSTPSSARPTATTTERNSSGSTT
ncbi:response regulator transcription factor [Streptomyces sp. NPDC058914]|uniref:response regulator transcription factor n=1 Tax=Streptomyces TaxID=1883 RepID=UPI0036971DE7